MTKAVIATVAEDRPGIVSELSRIVHDLELNIEDSRMTVLGGEFAVLMSVAGEDDALVELDSKLSEQAASGGFAYLFRKTGDRTQKQHQLFTATVEAMDHPGIVSAVTRFFSDRGANIRELTTETTRAAHTGAPVFNLTMEIEVTTHDAIGDLREAFVAFCAAESLDGELIAL
jgi:glycine cleavage system transcriptional repressor